MNETTAEPGREVSTDKFSEQLARKEGEFALALPTDRMGRPMVAAGRFVRALLTTVSMNPKLLKADRRSFWDASSRSAIDGLLPDGKEAALVPFEIRRKGPDGKWGGVLVVQYIPMIGGYRRLVRESGIDWHLRVVHEKDQFEYVLGDDERILHVPSNDDDPGQWTHVYAIAKRQGEIIARDVMGRAAVFRIRDRSEGWKSMMRIDNEKGERDKAIAKSAWGQWEEEMALKTVAKRQVKVLPLSTDSLIYDVLRREDAEQLGQDTIRPQIASAGSLSEKMRALADQSEANAEEDGDDDYTDIDQDGDVVDKTTGEVTKPAAAAPSGGAAAAPETAQPSSSSQKAVSAETSGATNASAAGATQRVSELKAPDTPTDAPAPAAPASDAAAAGAGPSATVYTLTEEQAKKIRKFADMLMGAQSQRTVQKGAINFLEDESYPEGSAAELAVVAIRDAHLARAAGKSSPSECDMVRDRVTRV